MMFHCVLIFSHRAPRAQLLRDEPSSRETKRTRRHLLNTSSEVDLSCLHRQGRDMVRARFDEWDPELVINWLGASRFCKDIRRIHQAAHAFKNVYAHYAGVSMAASP
eukprot:7519668-Pyramimonas_sp.AAC.1